MTSGCACRARRHAGRSRFGRRQPVPDAGRECAAAQHFDSYWPALQLGLGIDSLQVYAQDRPPLATWPSNVLAEVKHDGAGARGHRE
jgi:hypothetical protein